MSTEPEPQAGLHGHPQGHLSDPHARLRRLLERLELAGQHARAARARQVAKPQIELATLEHLVVAGGLTPGELGHRLGLTSGGVTALTTRLIDAGYVDRTDHPFDKRSRILTASAAGRALVADYLEPVLAPVADVVAELSAEEIERLEPFLDRLTLAKEQAAAATPGPEPERIRDNYTPALLM